MEFTELLLWFYLIPLCLWLMLSVIITLYNLWDNTIITIGDFIDLYVKFWKEKDFGVFLIPLVNIILLIFFIIIILKDYLASFKISKKIKYYFNFITKRIKYYFNVAIKSPIKNTSNKIWYKFINIRIK